MKNRSLKLPLTRRTVVLFSLLSFGMLLFPGCQGALVTLMYLFNGNEVKPEFMFLTEKGPKTVAVVCRSLAANQYETQNVPRDVARQVGDILHAKVKNKKLKVVEATQVDAWLDNCDNIFNDFLEVGRAKSIAADYVIGIELIGFQLRDHHSPHLLQGKARVQVRAFDCKTGETVANKSLNIIYPPNLPIPGGPGVDQPFRAQFVQTISTQIALLFHHHDPNTASPMDADAIDMHKLN